MSDSLPTPRTTLRARYVDVLVFCKACRPPGGGGPEALVEAGRGDVPLKELRFRCSRCGSDLTDFVVTAKDTRPNGR